MSREFSEQLRAAREAAGLSRAQLAARLRVSNTHIGYWETGTRVPPEDRQREMLAACRKPRADVAELVAKFEADLAGRVAELSGDLETLFAQRAVTPALEDAARKVKATPRRKAR